MRTSEPRQAVLAALLLLAMGAAACDAQASGSRPAPSASQGERVTLPAGFPVLPGARPEPPSADDPSAIARWTSDESGPVAYDFYLAALPAAGYSTRGLFPGGTVAVIRFGAPNDATWQLVLTRAGDGTRIEVRLDQP